MRGGARGERGERSGATPRFPLAAARSSHTTMRRHFGQAFNRLFSAACLFFRTTDGAGAAGFLGFRGCGHGSLAWRGARWRSALRLLGQGVRSRAGYRSTIRASQAGLQSFGTGRRWGFKVAGGRHILEHDLGDPWIGRLRVRRAHPPCRYQRSSLRSHSGCVWCRYKVVTSSILSKW